jgi:RF-1 domain
MPYRFLTDAALLTQCRVDHYRGSGPGGQKRNKTSNAVRIVHVASGVLVTATECRSTELNTLHAIRRLRVKMAADLREPIALETFAPPDWFLTIRAGNRIAVSHRHDLYGAAGGLALDLLKATAGSPSAVAANLGVTTTAVIKLLGDEHAWWMAANQIRAETGKKPLTAK